MTTNELSFIYTGLASGAELVVCVLNYVAVIVALTRRLTRLLRWLIPLALTHTASLVGLCYEFVCHLLRVRYSLGIAEVELAFRIVDGVLVLVTAVLVLQYVIHQWESRPPA